MTYRVSTMSNIKPPKTNNSNIFYRVIGIILVGIGLFLSSVIQQTIIANTQPPSPLAVSESCCRFVILATSVSNTLNDSERDTDTFDESETTPGENLNQSALSPGISPTPLLTDLHVEVLISSVYVLPATATGCAAIIDFNVSGAPINGQFSVRNANGIQHYPLTTFIIGEHSYGLNLAVRGQIHELQFIAENNAATQGINLVCDDFGGTNEVGEGLSYQATPLPPGTATATLHPSTTPTATDMRLANNAKGNALIHPFYDLTMSDSDSMDIKLQLIFDEWFLTPAPQGEITVVPATQALRHSAIIPDLGLASSYPIAHGEYLLQNAPAFVIAELACSDESFTGCGQKDTSELALEGFNIWNWTIQPLEGITGKQRLSLNLYAANETGNLNSQRPIWIHDFEITIDDGKTILDRLIENSGLLFALGAGLLLVIIGLVLVLRRTVAYDKS
jgi:hypothetical protein